jgi:hypothetical protein
MITAVGQNGLSLLRNKDAIWDANCNFPFMALTIATSTPLLSNSSFGPVTSFEPGAQGPIPSTMTHRCFEGELPSAFASVGCDTAVQNAL